MTEAKDAVERSYQLLAVLDVAIQSARWIAEQGQGHTPRDAGSLANVLELASELAGAVHDFLET
jgi:hypothetical protein